MTDQAMEITLRAAQDQLVDELAKIMGINPQMLAPSIRSQMQVAIVHYSLRLVEADQAAGRR